MSKTPRKKVYRAIEEELVARKSLSRLGSIEKYVKYLDVLLGFAKNNTNPSSLYNSAAALRQIKKLAAIAIECMEEYGVFLRSDEPPVRMRSPRLAKGKT